jgi:hypothetical protein
VDVVNWRKFWEKSFSRKGLKSHPPADPTRPATSHGLGGTAVTNRPHVFDPALKHFGHGLLPEEPVFATPEERSAYRTLQRRVMSHVLQAISESPCKQHLVLRGSALMRTWFGEQARHPKDLDFIVTPTTFSIHDNRTTAMFEEIVAAVTSRPCPGVELRPDEVATDDIWTYERVPGTRLVFRWTADQMPWGATQLDFVFGEPLPIAPEFLNVNLDHGPPAGLFVASKSLSLAWKLLWLHSDFHPRGKDLYDAMLLAEATSLPRHVLESVFTFAKGEAPPQDQLTDFYVNTFEWVGFEQHDESEIESWKQRLRTALNTTAYRS